MEPKELGEFLVRESVPCKQRSSTVDPSRQRVTTGRLARDLRELLPETLVTHAAFRGDRPNLAIALSGGSFQHVKSVKEPFRMTLPP